MPKIAAHNFTPGGRTHLVLARLAEGPCIASDLFSALGYPDEVSEPKRKAFWRLVDVLKRDGLIFQGWDKAYEILPAGQDALERLDAEASPTIRVFARAA